jgi:hypothetical protein
VSDDAKPDASEKKTRKASDLSASGKQKSHKHFAGRLNPEQREIMMSDKRMLQTELICQMYLQGFNFFEISKTTELAIPVVKDVIDESRRVWVERHNRSLTDLMAEQVAKIDQVESRAWESYYMSRKAYLEEQESSGSNDKGSFSSTRKTKRKQVGSAEFLNIILNCVKQRSELLGLNKKDDDQGVRHNSMLVVVNTPDEARAIQDFQQFQDMVDGEIVREHLEQQEQDSQG